MGPNMRFHIMKYSHWLAEYQAMNTSMRVAVGDDQAGGQHHLAHVVDVADGDEVFQVIELADRNRPA